MNHFRAKGNRQTGPEAKIQNSIIAALRAVEWLVVVMHGNEFQAGVPDLYCAHRTYGQRWIEVKNSKAYRFTEAQNRMFPLFASAGVGIWILDSAEPDQLQLLMAEPNWWQYLPSAQVRTRHVKQK